VRLFDLVFSAFALFLLAHVDLSFQKQPEIVNRGGNGWFGSNAEGDKLKGFEALALEKLNEHSDS